MKIGANPAMMLLGIWLVLNGLLPLLHISFQGQAELMSMLAVAAGALLLMNK